MLDPFKGQLSLNDLYGLTYKELGYLREMRIKRKKETAEFDEASAIAAALSGKRPENT